MLGNENKALQGSQVNGEDQPPTGYTRNLDTSPENFPFLCIIDGANDAGDVVRVGPYRGDTNYFVKDLINVSLSGGTETLEKTAAETVTVTASGWIYYAIDTSAGYGSMSASDAVLSFSTTLPSEWPFAVIAYVDWDATNSRISTLQQIQYESISIQNCCGETTVNCASSCSPCPTSYTMTVSGTGTGTFCTSVGPVSCSSLLTTYTLTETSPGSCDFRDTTTVSNVMAQITCPFGTWQITLSINGASCTDIGYVPYRWVDAASPSVYCPQSGSITWNNTANGLCVSGWTVSIS